MSPRRAGAAGLAVLAALLGIPSMAAAEDEAAAPAVLACATEFFGDWHASPPQFVAVDPDPHAEIGAPIVHLAPATGRWFLEVPGAAALTVDGGTFAVTSEGLVRWFDEWVGVDGSRVLRIAGGGHYPFRFVYLSHDRAALIGGCVAPDEPFLFLEGEAAP